MSAHAHTSQANELTCTIWYVRRRLGRQDYQRIRLIRLIEQLIAQMGFPPPLPQLSAGELVADVTLNSAWNRPAVDAWLDDRLPPENAAALDDQAKAAAAAEMDAAAGNLRLVAGGRA